MTLREALSRARSILIDRDIEDAALEGELLLRHTLGISRVQLYLNLDYPLDPWQWQSFWKLVGRRLSGEPAAYITEHREFYGHDFSVDSRVLIPRPETELLVETTLGLVVNRPAVTIVDVGTGSGAVAVSLALALPEAKIYATDMSEAALEVALRNCRRNGVENRIRLLQGDLLEPLPVMADILVTNMPYVKSSEVKSIGLADYEPLMALDGGSDGLEVIRRLCYQVGDRLRSGGSLLLEVGQGQAEAVADLLGSLFPLADIEIKRDPGGIERVVWLRLPATDEAGLACPLCSGTYP